MKVLVFDCRKVLEINCRKMYVFACFLQQSIINLKKVKSLKADINRKIRVTLVNGEQIIVSRMYSEALRKRLGIK